jgi:hypothetical protein
VRWQQPGQCLLIQLHGLAMPQRGYQAICMECRCCWYYSVQGVSQSQDSRLRMSLADSGRCLAPAAVLYYAPVADKVLEMAQMREGLPQIRGLRLSYKTAHTWRPTSEQEVWLRGWEACRASIMHGLAPAGMLIVRGTAVC